MEASPDIISRVEAVVSSIDQDSVELQIAGSYETFQWPRNMLNGNVTVGGKIILELKNHPLTNIQKVVENAKETSKDKNPTHLRKILESLIN